MFTLCGCFSSKPEQAGGTAGTQNAHDGIQALLEATTIQGMMAKRPDFEVVILRDSATVEQALKVGAHASNARATMHGRIAAHATDFGCVQRSRWHQNGSCPRQWWHPMPPME